MSRHLSNERLYDDSVPSSSMNDISFTASVFKFNAFNGIVNND